MTKKKEEKTPEKVIEKPKEKIVEKPKEKIVEKPKVISINKITKSEEKPKEKIIENKKEKRGRPKKVKLDVNSRKDIPENNLPESTSGTWSTKQKLGFWAGVTLTVLGIGIVMYKIKIAMDKARLEDEEKDEKDDNQERDDSKEEKTNNILDEIEKNSDKEFIEND